MHVSPSAPASTRSERRAFARVGGLAAGLAMAITATYVVPLLSPLRPWAPGSRYVPFWNVVGREWMGEGAELDAENAKVDALKQQAMSSAPEPPAPATARPPGQVFPPYVPPAKLDRPEHGIEFPQALDHYFERLTLVDLGVPGAIARAGHWGDSVLSLDGITSGIRRRLQRRFGDAGHGFHLMDRYHVAYRQQGIEFHSGGAWYGCLVVQACSKADPRYGYGGLVVHSGGGAASTWKTPSEGFGQTVSLFELWFSRKEHGGKVEIVTDGASSTLVDTRGPDLQDDWFRLTPAPGPHSFTVRAAGGGDVQLYGVVLENAGPGVVWDGMVLVGGSTRGLRTQEPTHIAGQIRHRDLDLIVFMFGGNDMERNHVDCKKSMQPYLEEYREALTHFRAGKPQASCLIMSLTDHGKRTPDGRIVSRPFAAKLAKAQRAAAEENGCGFFDTYAATGGEGTAARWYRARPALLTPDLGHPTSFGHEVIAGLLVNALLHGYQEYRARMEDKPLPSLDAPSKPHDSRNEAPRTSDEH